MQFCPNCGEENPDRARFCLRCAHGLAEPSPGREQRRVVTIVFCDVVGSTALAEQSDPEAFRSLLAGYLDRMKRVLDAHGGTAEKFIGDAVMAVFGAPVVHEDDAARACLAALRMQDELADLGLEGRIGVMSGAQRKSRLPAIPNP
jgi:class 3 adenylate cyclase